MARKVEERIDAVEQELQQLPIMEENLSLISNSIQEISDRQTTAAATIVYEIY